MFSLYKFCRNAPIESSRNRQGRQQNGDTYTLEISFPAVKYVYFNDTIKLIILEID